jgi:uncharacterized protein (DUF433 family)
LSAEARATLSEIVWIDPDRLSGEPCFRGTRVPVQALLDNLEGDVPLDEFLLDFPSVTREQAIRFIALTNNALDV